MRDPDCYLIEVGEAIGILELLEKNDRWFDWQIVDRSVSINWICINVVTPIIGE